MTADELRKLAEIAGFEFSITDEGEISGLFKDNTYIMNFRRDWQPHLRIEQAMMVAEGIPENKRFHYIDELKKIVPLYSGGWFLINATAEQRCRAALAAVKE